MASIDDILACRDRWLEALSSGRPVDGLVEATLHGCREAVAQLGSELLSLGYPSCEFQLPSPPDLDGLVARIEAQTNVPVPKVLRAFWRIVGGISLVDLKKYKHVAFWDDRVIQGAHQFCDGVYVDACDEAWLEYTAEDFSAYAEDDDEDAFLYSLAPDGYHKDDISGGEPYAIGRGSDWAPKWERFQWSGYRRPETAVPDPPDFISYLRTAVLECAGFPGLLGHDGFESIRQDLVRGLPPF